jgi:segregation and condensation protein B
MELATSIEALLFASDQPLGTSRLAEVLSNAPRQDIEAALRHLEAAYAAPERAFRLVKVAGGWQLATKTEYAEVIRRLYTGKRRVRLTKAALETLAIVAYKQPTTRPEIDAIRGVASGGVLETLLERSLVQIAGRSEGVGRPLLYATTPEFLQYLGLDRLADLPSLEELEAMLAEREAAARLADEEEMQALAEAAPPTAADDTPEAGLEPGAAAAGRPPAARLDERMRERRLTGLEELDAELRVRSDEVAQLSARVAEERARHLAEGGPAPGALAAEPAASDPSPDEPAPPPTEVAPDAP